MIEGAGKEYIQMYQTELSGVIKVHVGILVNIVSIVALLIASDAVYAASVSHFFKL